MLHLLLQKMLFYGFTQDQGDTNIATGATVSVNARYYYVDN